MHAYTLAFGELLQVQVVTHFLLASTIKMFGPSNKQVCEPRINYHVHTNTISITDYSESR
jgi:hypothetical protein